MGSGSSKSDPKKAGQQKGAAENNKTSAPKSPERVLLGSSEPPKGPWASKGAQHAVKGPERGYVKGNGVDGTQSKGSNHVTNASAGDHEARPVSSTKRVKR